jgi:hypothetical protein
MPCTKQSYLTEAHANAAQKKVAASFQRAGRGRDYKFLEAYECRACGLFHLGRAWKTARKLANHFTEKAPAPAPVPSTGDLRRKLERMMHTWERQDDHRRRQRAIELGRLIAAEKD